MEFLSENLGKQREQTGSQKGLNLNSCVSLKSYKTMENHGLPCSKNLGKTNKDRVEIMEIQEILKFQFMYFLEGPCSGGNGKCNRGTVRKSYQVSKHVDK